MQQIRVGFEERPLNAIGQAEPRLCYRQVVFLIVIVWWLCSRDQHRPPRTRDTRIPYSYDFHPRLWDPFHCNKTWNRKCVPPERKLAEKFHKKSVLKPVARGGV